MKKNMELISKGIGLDKDGIEENHLDREEMAKLRYEKGIEDENYWDELEEQEREEMGIEEEEEEDEPSGLED
jgi:hypothetical protein